MKNMKISVKLIVSFVVVIMLAVIIAAVGIIGMSQINSADDAMYNGNLLPIQYVGQIRVQYNIQRSYTRDLVIYPSEDPAFQSALDGIKNSEEEMEKFIALYLPTITTDEDRDNFKVFNDAYHNEYASVKKQLTERGLANDSEGAMQVMKTSAAAVQAIIGPALQQSMDLNAAYGQEAVNNNTTLFTTMTIVAVIVLVVSVIVSMILALYVSNMISKPVSRMKALMEQVGSQGDLDIPADVHNALKNDAQYKDEIAQSIKAFLNLIEHISLIAEELGVIANKDLSGHIVTLSPRDTLANSLVTMQNNLNEMFAEIMSSTNQVSSGSVQIADGAQLLAQGATEQSATVEELSASVSEISAQTKSNADLANEARDLGESIKQSAEKGNHQMGEMISAVNEISEASQSIGKVIKIIDDIAFQTNILALNAAVEAARAGQHGKGFAVVADEVRSLAAKSAEAAKNTSELIESSIKKSEMGAAISQETAESLRQIVEGILRSSELVSNIARSSNEQATAISQVSNGIDQVSQVVQQNSATAEESAAASEEMSGQATLLQQMVSQFTLKNASGYSSAAPAKVGGMSKPASMSSSMDTGFSMSSGKY